MVISRNGIVASESPLASQAGAHILERGGNAVDAAIATNAMMGVVEPMMNGIGGDLFAIVYDAKANKLYGLNASGWAPKGLTIEFLQKQGLKEMPKSGIHTIDVPGAVDGWQKLADKFGRKKLSEDLAPAIRTAREGFPVTELVAAYWAQGADKLRENEEATRVYLPKDHAPKTGEIFSNADLAAALEAIAGGGHDAFYKGELAKKMLAGMKRHGGTMVEEDLEKFSSEWVEPISTTYRDWTVYELPPNGEGLAALEMLNIMETFPLGTKGYEFGSTKALQLEIEAKKLAYIDLQKYIGEPRGQELPVARLLSKEWAAARAKLIDADHANCNPTAGEMEGGSRRKYGFADSEQLFFVWIGNRRAGNGICAAQSRRTFCDGCVLSECIGRTQAAATHDHSRLRAKRRRAAGVWNHGRLESSAGSRAVHCESRRL
jgi:gamma-glutamyltranspeptidase/glutathione hydrolase